MIAISFDKARAQQIIEAIRDGEPINPSADGWTQHDMLHAAGALYCAALTQGPPQMSSQRVASLPQEELVGDDLRRHLHAAIDFYGKMALAIRDEGYESRYERHIEAMLVVDDEGYRELTHVKGFKPR